MLAKSVSPAGKTAYNFSFKYLNMSRKLDYIDYFLMKYDPLIQQQIEKVLAKVKNSYYDVDEKLVKEMTAIAIIVAESVAAKKKQKIETIECNFYQTYQARMINVVECNGVVKLEAEMQYFRDTIVIYSDEKVYNVSVEENIHANGAVISVVVREY